MKAPKRINMCLKIIEDQKDLVEVTVDPKIGKAYKSNLLILSKNIEYLSIEKKQHRIKFANKIIKKTLFNKEQLTFFKRLKIGLKFMFTGNII